MVQADTQDTRAARLPLFYRDAVRLWGAVALSILLNTLIIFAIVIVEIRTDREIFDTNDRLLSSLLAIVTFSLVYLPLTWLFIARVTPEQLRAWARREAGRSWFSRIALGRALGSLFLLTVIPFALIAGLQLLRAGERTPTEVAVAAFAVVVSWLLLHTSYALEYAYYYHRDGGGLSFPGEEEPCATDFAYFAFAVGTTFAASDVDVTHRRMRRIVLAHGLLSFAYNTALLALVINVVFGR